MHANALTPGEYLRAAEFGILLPNEPTLTIANVGMQAMVNLKPGAAADSLIDKGVVYFREEKRGWVMNVTNRELMKALFGDNTEDWVSKRVTLHAPIVDVGKKKEPGIRVKGAPHLERPLKVTVKLPRKRPQEFTLVPTGNGGGQGGGAQRQGNGNGQSRSLLDGFLAACHEQLGLNSDDVRAWAEAESIGVAAMNRDQLGELFRALSPDGARRASFDGFVAGGPGPGDPGPGDGGDAPPPQDDGGAAPPPDTAPAGGLF